jgi:hypothetical protein
LAAFAEGEFELAQEYYRTAARLAPKDKHIQDIIDVHLSFPTLALGDYERGLELYEGRWHDVNKKTHVWELGATPQWHGENLAGRHLMVHQDQGDGDTIQFCRFLSDMVPKAGRISLVVPPRLMRLMKQLPGVEVLDQHGDLPIPDYHSPMASYMRFIGRKFPAWDGPYLDGNSDNHLPIEWPEGDLRIGLCWSARRTDDGHQRSIPLELLFPLVAIPRTSFCSLQLDGSGELDRSCAGVFFRNMSGQIRDWRDTADIIKDLDLVVSVDTAILHLAGAMGKECVALLPYRASWRWGAKTAETTPWYPTMTLFRQIRPHDWSEPVSCLKLFIEGYGKAQQGAAAE